MITHEDLIRYLTDDGYVFTYDESIEQEITEYDNSLREEGKQMALADLAEHDKEVRNKAIEECIRIAYTYDDRGFTVEDVKRITDGIVKQFEQMKEGGENG